MRIALGIRPSFKFSDPRHISNTGEYSSHYKRAVLRDAARGRQLFGQLLHVRRRAQFIERSGWRCTRYSHWATSAADRQMIDQVQKEGRKTRGAKAMR